MSAVNPEITIIPHQENIIIESELPEVDIVMDCLDNFQSRLVLEKIFWKKDTPIIHGGISQYFGQVTTLIPGKTANFSELFGEDIVRMITGGYHFIARNSSSEPLGDLIPSRRKLVSQLAIGIAAIPFASIMYGVFKGKYNYKVISHTLYFDDLPKAFET